MRKSTPASNTSLRKEERFRAFLGVPIIQRRQLLGVLVVQQRELRQYDESEESFTVTLATQMAAILSQSQLTALFGQYRQTRIRALPAAPRCGDCRRLAGCHVTFNGTGVSGINAGSGSGTRTIDRALKKRQTSFAATANALPPEHKRNGGYFRSLLAPAFGHPAASRIVCRG